MGRQFSRVARTGIFTCVALTVAMGTSAAAHGATLHTPTWGTSCIDADNNGACNNPGDIPIADALAGSEFYTAPTDSTAGLVIQGGVFWQHAAIITVNGNISVSGSMTRADNSEVGTNNFISTHGDIHIAPNTSITTDEWVLFQTLDASSAITVGDNFSWRGTRFAGPFSGVLQVLSAGSVQVGSNTKFAIAGKNGAAELDAAGSMQVGAHLAASGVGSFGLKDATQLALDQATIKSGDAEVFVGPSASSPAAALTIGHSVIATRTLNLIADDGISGTSGQTSMTLDHDKITVQSKKFPATNIVPMPTCIATKASRVVCG